MNASQLHQDIQSYCQQNADAAQVKKYAIFFTEGYDAYGLTKEKFEAKVDALINEQKVTMRLVLSTAPRLIKTGKYEETNFAVCLLARFGDQLDVKTFGAIEKWFDIGIINWAHCDVLCGMLMTPLFEKKIIKLNDLAGWRTAENTYQRRAVPVSMLALLKTTKNYKPLFAFINPLMNDSEKKVQQGLGWFCREAWKIQPEPTEEFLLKHKDTAPRTIFQYATEKMTPENKKRFKKAK